MSELRSQLEGRGAAVGILDGAGSPSPPTAAELAVPIVAPGRPALLPVGIVYQAGWEPLADGMARHARLAVLALASTGLPVALETLPTRRMSVEEDLDPEVVRQVGYLRHVSFSRVALAIRQCVIHNRQYLENVICPAAGRLSGIVAERSIYQATVISTSWERTTVSPDVVEVLNRVADVWVPCEANAEAFRRAGVERVTVMPCPYDPNEGASRLAFPRGPEAAPRGKRFYAIGKWEPRKNYHALIGAFLRTFEPGRAASLLVKTLDFGGWVGYPNAAQSIPLWLDDPAVRVRGWTLENVHAQVRIVNAKLPEARLMDLHRLNNIYVSASHGEAWDLPAFDARAAGNRLVYASFGGPTAYAGVRDVGIATAGERFEPVHSQYGWESDALWARVGTEDIGAALEVVQAPTRRVHPPEFAARFGIGAVGRRMRERLVELSPAAMDECAMVGGFG